MGAWPLELPFAQLAHLYTVTLGGELNRDLRVSLGQR